MIHVDAMRVVDRYAGTPICWLLSMLRFVASRLSRRVPPQPRKILIIKFSEMGSTVLAWPAFEELQRRLPGVQLVFLTFRMNRTLFDAMNPPGPVLDVDVSSPMQMALSGAKVIWRLLGERIDTTIDMDFFSRISAIVAYIVCRGNRVGFDRFTGEGLDRGNLLTHRVMYSPHVHTAAAFLSLARAVTAPDPDGIACREAISLAEVSAPAYKPRPHAVAAVSRRLADSGVIAGSRIVLINPNSSDLFPLRRWPIESYTELCRRLIQDMPDLKLVITGTASEKKDAEAILGAVRDPRCVSFAGRTTFDELLALYSLSSAMVTNDSGPGHFAALLRLPTVVLFGPETPSLYGPLNPNAHSMYSNFACSPCVSVYNAKKSACTRSKCLEAISVEAVLEKVKVMLSGGTASSLHALAVGVQSELVQVRKLEEVAVQ